MVGKWLFGNRYAGRALSQSLQQGCWYSSYWCSAGDAAGKYWNASRSTNFSVSERLADPIQTMQLKWKGSIAYMLQFVGIFLGSHHVILIISANRVCAGSRKYWNLSQTKKHHTTRRNLSMNERLTDSYRTKHHFYSIIKVICGDCSRITSH